MAWSCLAEVLPLATVIVSTTSSAKASSQTPCPVYHHIAAIKLFAGHVDGIISTVSRCMYLRIALYVLWLWNWELEYLNSRPVDGFVSCSN